LTCIGHEIALLPQNRRPVMIDHTRLSRGPSTRAESPRNS
jgi:hypothetical protein